MNALTKPAILLGCILLMALIVALRGIGNPNLGIPDADRILMDGVFIGDFLRDLPLSNIYDYTLSYYAQYPALSIGYRPPFFPFFEGLFNNLFGINQWSSRLALMGFWLSGITAWFLLVKRTHDLETAFWSALLLATSPYLVQWAWYTMAELPALAMVLITAFTFQRYLNRERDRDLMLTALMLGLAAWTKQTTVFVGLWILMIAITGNRLPKMLKRRGTWYSVALLLLVLTPLIFITLWMGEKHMVQSVGKGEAASVTSRLQAANLFLHPRYIWDHHLPKILVLLSLGGIAWAMIKKQAHTAFYLLWIVAVYCVFTYLVAKEVRYTLFWIPPLLLFAVLPLMAAARSSRIGATLIRGGLVLLIGYQLNQVYDQPLRSATGYEEAAQYVLTASDSRSIFFDGYNNGYFTWFVRRNDDERQFQVLRGDKLLSSSSINTDSFLRVHADSDEDIQRLLDEHGVHYIVVESNQDHGLAIHRRLREYLKKGPFVLERKIAVEAVSRKPLSDQQLLIYRYTSAKPASPGDFKLHLPTVGKTVIVPRHNANPANNQPEAH